MTRLRLFILGMALLLPLQAAAKIITFNTADSQFLPGSDNQGFWASVSGNTTSANANFMTGFHNTNGTPQEYRSFFTFDLSSLDLTGYAIKSATLRLRRFGMEAANGTGITIQFFDVTTDAKTLNDNVGANAAIFADLGTGVPYGRFTVPFDGNTAPETHNILKFVLNANARREIAEAAGGFFSVGGRVWPDPDVPSIENNLFSSSFGGTPPDSNEVDQFVLNLVAIPEPAALGLFVFGLTTILILARRLRRRA